MFNFFEFYANGGVFMHAISLTAVAAVTALALDLRARKLGDDGLARLRLADRLVGLGLGLGLLGGVFGMIDFGAALASLDDPAVYQQAVGRGLGIVGVPLAWALMVGIPIFLAGTLQRRRATPGVDHAGVERARAA